MSNGPHVLMDAPTPPPPIVPPLLVVPLPLAFQLPFVKLMLELSLHHLGPQFS